MLVNFFTKNECEEILNHFLQGEKELFPGYRFERRGIVGSGNDYGVRAPDTTAVYGDTFFEKYGLKILPLMEKAAFKPLYPTYIYGRFYREGFTLPEHTDRPSCEISTTITIAYGDRDEPWDFFCRTHLGEDLHVVIECGQGWVYQGCIEPHWRKELDKGWQLQMFFHYIELGGPIHKQALENGHDFSEPYNDIPFDFAKPNPSYNNPKYVLGERRDVDRRYKK